MMRKIMLINPKSIEKIFVKSSNLKLMISNFTQKINVKEGN